MYKDFPGWPNELPVKPEPISLEQAISFTNEVNNFKDSFFTRTVSSEIGAPKPLPDVYTEISERVHEKIDRKIIVGVSTTVSENNSSANRTRFSLKVLDSYTGEDYEEFIYDREFFVDQDLDGQTIGLGVLERKYSVENSLEPESSEAYKFEADKLLEAVKKEDRDDMVSALMAIQKVIKSGRKEVREPYDLDVFTTSHYVDALAILDSIVSHNF